MATRGDSDPEHVRRVRSMHLPGCSNFGKYRHVPGHAFCGPPQCPESWPVMDQGHMRNAWQRRRFHPDQVSLALCLYRKARELGLETPAGAVYYLHEHLHRKGR